MGIPPIHNAYRLPVTPDMPEWARLLYRSDIAIDVAEIDRAYVRWESEASLENERQWREPHEARGEENRFEEYYQRWRRELLAFRRPDGSFDFSQTPRDRARRPVAPEGALRSTGAGWSFVGPERVLTSANENPATPLMVQQSNVYCFDVAPTNPDILYSGTESGVLSNSTDKGATWTQLGAQNSLITSPLASIAISPANANELYLAST